MLEWMVIEVRKHRPSVRICNHALQMTVVHPTKLS